MYKSTNSTQDYIRMLGCIWIILLSACSSSYTPSSTTLEFKKNMSSNDAINVLQKMIWNENGYKGICGSRGFWFDEASNMVVHNDKISMLSHKRGKEIKKHQKKYDDLVFFEKQYFKYDFEFNKVKVINVYDDPLRLPVFPYCNVTELESDYFIIDLYGDKLNNLKFVVIEKNFDQVMAALMILLENKPIIVQ